MFGSRHAYAAHVCRSSHALKLASLEAQMFSHKGLVVTDRHYCILGVSGRIRMEFSAAILWSRNPCYYLSSTVLSEIELYCPGLERENMSLGL